MKKYVHLFLLGLLPIGLKAQQVIPSRTTAIGHIKHATENIGTSVSLLAKKQTRSTPFFPSTIGSRENLGGTTYDLQTNGSMQRRVLQMGNKISCFWTFSVESPATMTGLFEDRGTAYAHFDGANWTSAPIARLESIRTGFSSAFLNGNNEESFIVHDNGYKLHIGKKSGAAWSINDLGTSYSNFPIWAHAASSGNWLYVIASPLDSNIHANGLRNGYFFSRSNDNGATWINDMIPLPLIDSVGHYRGGGNSYAISARGKYVAILCGDMGTDLTLVSSNDYGATWTKKVIMDWPINNFDFAGTMPTDVDNNGTADTIFCNDGSQTLALDDSGTAHIAFPVIRVYKPGSTFGYFFSSSLAYYNSIADTIQLVDNVLHDCNGDGQFGIGVNYTSNVSTDADAAYNTIGTITQPMISIVQGNPQKILITYTAIMDNDTTVDDGVNQYWAGASVFTGQNYRDILVIGTKDSGSSWTFPVNISKTKHFEEAFPSTPEVINGDNLPVLYQGDIEPGTILQNNDAFEPVFQNIMILHNVSINQLFTVGADSSATCGAVDLPLGIKTIVSNNFNAMSIFPNPANDEISFSLINQRANEIVNYSISDITGRLVAKGKLQYSKTISTKNFNKGVYTLQIETSTQKANGKFIKQ
jgi:hypothetical protein